MSKSRSQPLNSHTDAHKHSPLLQCRTAACQRKRGWGSPSVSQVSWLPDHCWKLSLNDLSDYHMSSPSSRCWKQLLKEDLKKILVLKKCESSQIKDGRRTNQSEEGQNPQSCHGGLPLKRWAKPFKQNCQSVRQQSCPMTSEEIKHEGQRFIVLHLLKHKVNMRITRWHRGWRKVFRRVLTDVFYLKNKIRGWIWRSKCNCV